MPSVPNPARVARLVAAHGPRVDRLCGACVAGLPGIGGAGLAVMTSMPAQQVRYTSDQVSSRIEESQMVLGEGPGLEAFTHGRPVLATDLDDGAWLQRWPAFAPAAVEAGARAVFALPLRAGTLCVGVFDLYRAAPGTLAGADLAEALAFAGAATELLLAEQLPGGRPAGGGEPAAHRTAVHQATGMVSAQLAVPTRQASIRLRARAYATERSLDDVAGDVVARRLRFEETGHGE